MPIARPPLIGTPERFAAAFDVPRETLDRLRVFERLLKRWQKGTNLVAPATLPHIWHRHFADSAQLLAHAPGAATWLDLGSGAGFPGLVIAVCAANREDTRVHLVESNARKCAFLHEVVRETECPVEIHQCRIESLHGRDRLTGVDCVTARALAPMGGLLALAAPFFGAATRGLFLKGQRVETELVEARAHWRYDSRLHPSLTDAQARIVEVRDVRRDRGMGPGHVETADE